jgi:hypothetical protein
MITQLVGDTVARGIHPVFLVEDEYRAALLDAEAGFIRDLIARITDPARGWATVWNSYHADARRSATDENTKGKS